MSTDPMVREFQREAEEQRERAERAEEAAAADRAAFDALRARIDEQRERAEAAEDALAALKETFAKNQRARFERYVREHAKVLRLERERDRALDALRECIDAIDSVTHRGNLEADIEKASLVRRRARVVLAELEGDTYPSHPYTVDVILHGAEPYPCVICGKSRQEHGGDRDGREQERKRYEGALERIAAGVERPKEAAELALYGDWDPPGGDPDPLWLHPGGDR